MIRSVKGLPPYPDLERDAIQVEFAGRRELVG